ncbi:hypothetical protein, partial [Haloparvum sp. AD34]
SSPISRFTSFDLTTYSAALQRFTRAFEKELPVDPVLDNWLKGDQTDVRGDVRPGNDELPLDIEDARKKARGKYFDEFGFSQFHIYRFENNIEISFETPDGEVIDRDSVEIEFGESGVEPADARVSLKERENPTTVTPKSEINGIPVLDWHGGYGERSSRKPRHYQYDLDFEFEGVEGVRLMTITGGHAAFVSDWAERVGDDAADFFKTVWNWDVDEQLAQLAMLAAPGKIQFLLDYLSVVPNIFSFVEFIVLADGRRYTRVWDASQYPSLATYVDGKRRSLEKVSYNPREPLNLRVSAFLGLASAGATPYHSPLDFYGRLIEDEELMEAVLTEKVEEIIDIFSVDWDVEQFYPRVPRQTVGLDANGNPVNNPSKPFDLAAGLEFPWSETIEPN